MNMSDAIIPAAQRAAQFGMKAPNPALRFFEVRALIEAALLLPALPFLAARRRGDGQQVMLLPGFMADDGAMWALRRYLTYLGYDALPWGLGRNRGRPEADAERVLERIAEVRREDEPIILVGWSLGGVIAREVARRAPDVVREVITLGAPVEGGPKYTATGERFASALNIDLDAIEHRVHAANTKGVDCPLTVIYSRGDAIVNWRAAIDRYNPQAFHRRVPGSHLGMIVNPAVWWQVASALARSKAQP